MSGYPGVGGRSRGWDRAGVGQSEKWCSLGFLITLCSQLCDLPATSLNDQLPQHMFRVVWTAGDAQKECVLLKGEPACSRHPLQQPPSHPCLPVTGVLCYPCSVSQAAKRAGAGTPPRMSSSSGDEHREAHAGAGLCTLGSWVGCGGLKQMSQTGSWG